MSMPRKLRHCRALGRLERDFCVSEGVFFFAKEGGSGARSRGNQAPSAVERLLPGQCSHPISDMLSEAASQYPSVCLTVKPHEFLCSTSSFEVIALNWDHRTFDGNQLF